MMDRHAMQHNARTGHKYLIQTPEAILNRTIERKPYTKKEFDAVVAKGETKMIDFIYSSGKTHMVECRCMQCFNAYLDKAVKDSDTSVEGL